jgi:hypothetical protein
MRRAAAAGASACARGNSLQLRKLRKLRMLRARGQCSSRAYLCR